MPYEIAELISRMDAINDESRAAFAYLFSDPARGAATLNILNDANVLDVAMEGNIDDLPPYTAQGLQAADFTRIQEISFDPDEFEFLVNLYSELYPDHEDPLATAKSELYDEVIDEAASGIQDEILADREASTVVMELALGISHRFDRDQQSVADDIVANFIYSHGMSPEDYADSVRNPDRDMLL
jgi:hypothetical protein